MAMSYLDDIETTANEDLMKEHGLLILLIYEQFIQNIESGTMFDYDLILLSAYIIRVLIEDYHEKIEETYVFPIVKQNGYESIVNELIKQHQLGRKLTNQIILCSADNKHNQTLVQSMKLFVKMYRYHESREDTEIVIKRNI